MKEVRKKSIDSATNAMLIKASRKQTELAWDRADAMQPQCGFGRMSICCTDCNEGPCRTNPFAASAQRTICGRGQKELVAGNFLKQVADGAAALTSLASSFGAEIGNRLLTTVCVTQDTMLIPADYSAVLTDFGDTTAQALQAITAAKTKVFGKAKRQVTNVNIGILKADAINVVLHGHIAPKTVKLIADVAASNSTPVNVVSLCGSELNLPVLTNYDSQETPLVTGAVDLLVVGSQCVMPATVALARAEKVSVVSAAVLHDTQKVKDAIESAEKAFWHRASCGVAIPEYTEKLYGGYSAANSGPIFDALNDGFAKGLVKGLVYLGGCGNIANTQDAKFIKLANNLLAEGYLVVAAGCAGIALAKAGMCRPEYTTRSVLKNILSDGVPPVLFLGACHDAGEYLQMAQAVSISGMPVYAAVAEISHNKVLATAAAFAAKGITVYIDLGEATLIPEVNLKGKILPLSDFEQLPQALARVAAAQ